jgi:DNA processing protein
MSRGVLIVEAPQKSGALITARFALEQNRDLWIASVGAANDEGRRGFDRRGSAALAAEGAGTVSSASDILEAWNLEPPGPEQDFSGSGIGLASSMARSLGIELQMHEEKTWR